jgi:hypothetical protein
MPQPAIAGNRFQAIEDGLPERAGRREFCNLLVGELSAAGLLKVDTIGGMVSPHAVMDSLTTALGRQFLRFVTSPAE